MMHDYIAAFVLLALCVASARVYGKAHHDKDYECGDRKAMASPREFELVYRWIRGSTLVCGLGALLTECSFWMAFGRSPLQTYAGLVIALLGFALFAAARRTLGRHYSPCYDSRIPTGIVQSGVYRRVRHPIYTANLATLAGLAVATGSLWITANFVLLAFYYWRSAVREEAALSAEHPEYLAYLARSGRFLPLR